MNRINIRPVQIEDAQKLLEIYSYYVKNTALTFEYDVPSLTEFKNRIKNTLKKYPYLVAESDNEIVGYAYAGCFNARAAYAWDAEMSIYLNPEKRRLGIGKQIYTLLENILKEQGLVKTIAIITFPMDEYSDFNSMQFHEKMGYKLSGKIENCGYKFNRWYTILYMDKIINPPKGKIKPVVPFDTIKNKFNL